MCEQIVNLGLGHIVYLEPYPDPEAKVILGGTGNNVKDEFFEGITFKAYSRVYGEKKMRQCPECHKWTMDFDEYFGRFRCLALDCGWMPPSTTEREIRLLQSRKQPTKLESVTIRELDLTLTPSYDAENDVFPSILDWMNQQSICRNRMAG